MKNSKVLVVSMIAVVVLGGVAIAVLFLNAGPSVEGPEATSGQLIRVRAPDGGLLPESLGRDLAHLSGISEAQPFLMLSADPNPILGVTPGQPIRLDTGNGLTRLTLIEGRNLEPEDTGKWVALAGALVTAEDYEPPSGMSGMVHRLKPGQSIVFNQTQRIRIVGTVTFGRDEADGVLILPLDRVQDIHREQGRVSGFWLVLEPAADIQSLTTSIAELTPGAEVAVALSVDT